MAIYQTVRSYRLSRDRGDVSCAAQNSTFKNHHTDTLRGKNHFYRIVLVHIIHKTALNTTKHLQVAGYNFFLIAKNSNFSLTASLTA